MTKPRGAPLRQGASSERTPSIWTWCDRFGRYNLIQFSTYPSMLEDFSLASRNRWLTESNAFAKSIQTKSTGCTLFLKDMAGKAGLTMKEGMLTR